MLAFAQGLPVRFIDWLLNRAPLDEQLDPAAASKIDWTRAVPFILMHIACLAAIWTGISPVAVAVAVALYVARMFFITAFYHRYFSHRSFKTGRAMQFAMAVLGCTAGQRGPLWWAGHHREHHLTSDTEADPHSPHHQGFWHSHTVWFLTRGSWAMPRHRVKDWLKFPELVWLESFEWVPLVALAAACYALGAALETYAPGLGTSGAQMLVVGFFWSTIALYHGTYSTNSLSHLFGRSRYETGDDSRNNWFVALVTLGEGWHNNHHYYPVSARHGFRWWEFDPTWLGLKSMHAVGLVSDFKLIPERLKNVNLVASSPVPVARTAESPR